MPMLITHAKPPAGLATLPALPHLADLLRLLQPSTRHAGEEDSLSPLHELLRAQALGLPVQDGLLPWAALQARSLGLEPAPADEGWAWITPCHWQVNADHVRMADPADCAIDTGDAQAVMQALQPFLAEDGVHLQGLHGGHWLARARAFHDLPTASLARASGGAVDHWLPRQPQARPLRRLQNELQMLLYAHPLNDARAARGLLPINSFWVSGTGSLPEDFDAARHTATTELDALAEPYRRRDGTAWAKAWQALDAGPLKALLEQARRGEPTELTLCGDTAAQTFTLQPQGLWARLGKRLGAAPDPSALLHSL